MRIDIARCVVTVRLVMAPKIIKCIITALYHVTVGLSITHKSLKLHLIHSIRVQKGQYYITDVCYEVI